MSATPASTPTHIWVQWVFRVDRNMSATPLKKSWFATLWRCNHIWTIGEMIKNIFTCCIIYLSTLGGFDTHKCIKSGRGVALIFVSFEKIVALILRIPYSYGINNLYKLHQSPSNLFSDLRSPNKMALLFFAAIDCRFSKQLLGVWLSAGCSPSFKK